MFEFNSGWAAVVISVATLIYTILDGRGKKTALKINNIDTKLGMKADAMELVHLAEKVDRVEDRMTTVEGEIKHLPDKDTAHDIQMEVAKLSGQVGIIAEQLKPVTAMAERIQQAMIEQVKFK
jgi:hypothetical protein